MEKLQTNYFNKWRIQNIATNSQICLHREVQILVLKIIPSTNTLKEHRELFNKEEQIHELVFLMISQGIWPILRDVSRSLSDFHIVGDISSESYFLHKICHSLLKVWPTCRLKQKPHARSSICPFPLLESHLYSGKQNYLAVMYNKMIERLGDLHFRRSDATLQGGPQVDSHANNKRLSAEGKRQEWNCCWHGRVPCLLRSPEKKGSGNICTGNTD